MSDVIEVRHLPEVVPPWIFDMEFCHIVPFDAIRPTAFCGHEGTEMTCVDYDGEAICPTCGMPTCPRCAQLSALAESL